MRIFQLMGVALLASALTLSACAVQQPDVNVRSVDLTGLTLSALKLKLGMKMDNPNDFALPITRIDWDLDVFGRALADGIVKLDKEVPPGARRASACRCRCRCPRPPPTSPICSAVGASPTRSAVR